MEDELDLDDVRHVASLARVDVTEDEVREYVEEFNEVLGYFDQLDDVDEDLELQDDLDNVVRADEVETGLSQTQATSNAEETEDGYIRGPRVS
ncbi:MAG: Asp-tRNA(Asn)/Glu-tRNA(Gln) amidotransferase subunit GatC [Halobacteriales archaeon]